MSAKIDQFCESLRQQLTKLESRVEQAQANLEAAPKKTEQALKEQLAEAKANIEAKKQEAEDAKTKLETWIEAKKTETEASIEEWKTKREQEKLIARADRAEEYAASAIVFALAAIEEAEVATLEAVGARLVAEETVES